MSNFAAGQLVVVTDPETDIAYDGIVAYVLDDGTVTIGDVVDAPFDEIAFTAGYVDEFVTHATL